MLFNRTKITFVHTLMDGRDISKFFYNNTSFFVEDWSGQNRKDGSDER
jgi:hypothetical protein